MTLAWIPRVMAVFDLGHSADKAGWGSLRSKRYNLGDARLDGEIAITI